jgi:hypothetical protein
LYKISVRPVLLYGCETWAIDTSDENKIIVFEGKDLRGVHVYMAKKR